MNPRDTARNTEEFEEITCSGFNLSSNTLTWESLVGAAFPHTLLPGDPLAHRCPQSCLPHQPLEPQNVSLSLFLFVPLKFSDTKISQKYKNFVLFSFSVTYNVLTTKCTSFPPSVKMKIGSASPVTPDLTLSQ